MGKWEGEWVGEMRGWVGRRNTVTPDQIACSNMCRAHPKLTHHQSGCHSSVPCPSHTLTHRLRMAHTEGVAEAVQRLLGALHSGAGGVCRHREGRGGGAT